MFSGYKHHTVATIRLDGGPRISGTEVQFDDGELCMGMMPGTRRGADMRRDARVALHSHCVDPPDEAAAWSGEAKISGVAVEMTPPEDIPERFRIDIREVVHVHLNEAADQLLVESWQPDRGIRIDSR